MVSWVWRVISIQKDNNMEFNSTSFYPRKEIISKMLKENFTIYPPDSDIVIYQFYGMINLFVWGNHWLGNTISVGTTFHAALILHMIVSLTLHGDIIAISPCM